MYSFLVLTAKKSLRFLFSRIVKSVLVQSTVTIWGKLVLWRFVFFFFVGNWIKISCLLAREKKRHYQKIIVSRRSIRMLEKLENAQVFSFLVLGAKKNCRVFSADLLKVYLSCAEQHLEEIYICWRFFSSWDFEKKFCALWQIKLSEVFKTSFYVSRRSVFSSKSLEKGRVFSSLVLTAKKLANTFWQICRNCTCLLHSNVLGKTDFWRFFFFLGFWV